MESKDKDVDAQERLLVELSIDMRNLKLSVTSSSDALTRQLADLSSDMRTMRDDRMMNKHEVDNIKLKLVALERRDIELGMGISAIDNRMRGIDLAEISSKIKDVDLVDFACQLKESASKLEIIMDAQAEAKLKRTTILGLGRTTWAIVGAILGTAGLLISLADKLQLLPFP